MGFVSKGSQKKKDALHNLSCMSHFILVKRKPLKWHWFIRGLLKEKKQTNWLKDYLLIKLWLKSLSSYLTLLEHDMSSHFRFVLCAKPLYFGYPGFSFFLPSSFCFFLIKNKIKMGKEKYQLLTCELFWCIDFFPTFESFLLL